MAFATETFDGAARTLETITGWTKHGSATGSAITVAATGRLRPQTASTEVVYYHNTDPAGADYDVQSTVVAVTIGQTSESAGGGPCGRIATGAYTLVRCRYRTVTGETPIAQFWLEDVIASVATTLATYTLIMTTGQSVVVVLKLRGSQASVTFDGVEQIPPTTVTPSAKGKAGLYMRQTSAQLSDTGGIHLDNWSATDAVPVNTVAPVLSGTPVVGYTLSTSNGTWSGATPTGYTYQWKRDAVDISGATSSTYTLISASAGSTITCAVTATSASGNSSPALSNGLLGVNAMVANDVQILQGGPDGIGGTPGAVITDPRAIFDDVLNAELAQPGGDIEYRLVYVKNAHTVQSATLTVAWVATNTSSPDTTLAIGVATEAVNTNVSAVADESSAPAGVTFGSPTSSGTGFSLGTIPAGQFKGVWLRRSVDQNATPVGTDAAEIDVTATPA